MCGIVAILGRHEVAPLILEALKRLEYRGYDSAGIATVHDGRLGRRRAVGKLIALSDLLVHDPIRGHAGIGHTRWATHGAADRAQRPPAPGRPGRRGAQRHHRELPRAARRARGRRRRSSRPTPTPRPSSSSATARSPPGRRRSRPRAPRSRGCEGAFALCFLFEGEDDLLVAARRGSPLAIGYGDGEIYRRLGRAGAGAAHPPHRLPRGGRPRRPDPRRVEIFDADGPPGHARDPPRPGGERLSPRRAPTSTSWPRRCTSSRR